MDSVLGEQKLNIEDAIKNKKNKIINSWFEEISSTYPPETARFLLSNKDKFSNPVGVSIKEAATGILDFLTQEKSLEEVSPFVDSIVRVRAVQDFTPAQAVSVFFSLKKCLRSSMENFSLDFIQLDSLVDDLALLAFDIYMKCREKIWEIKYNEFMNRPSAFFEGPICPSYALKKGLLNDAGNNDS
jgi:hypothetical protein